MIMTSLQKNGLSPSAWQNNEPFSGGIKEVLINEIFRFGVFD